MQALQQKCRPKHQALVLKCYPHTTKGAVDVKPNSSELSYLLFYAQSRRTKIQKVGGFLEKKTASDVYRQRIGNVQVTLQILTALIEKCPKDLPLFAGCVLKILEIVLKSSDLTMVESSIPTFEAFCEHHDPTSIVADHAYLKQYASVVRQYATLASTRAFPGKEKSEKSVWLKWRNVGLNAIKSIASADALSSVTGRQYDVMVPMILENLWTEEGFLETLVERAQTDEKADSLAMLRRRTSVTTVRTHETTTEPDPNPLALSGTAGDVDRLAEEQTGVLAMHCLEQIFCVPNRSQIHSATVALLKFIEERIDQEEEVVRSNSSTGKDSGWAIKMFILVTRWAPVQDRFNIPVTALQNLAQTPLTDDTLQHHVVIMAMVGALLRSDLNLIGLSVMDVLLQLLAQLRRLFQMPGDPQTASQQGLQSNQAAKGGHHSATLRTEMLRRIQLCIGDLATHVYYMDQISDMISAILLKLKPAPPQGTACSSPQGEKAEGSSSAGEHLQHVDASLFALTVAKTAALRSIKAILLVANPRNKMSGNPGLSRNRVPIQVWEGTQWLLRDPDGLVRKAFVDALGTWLDRETINEDQLAYDDSARHRLRIRSVPGSAARRAVSVTSGRAAACGLSADKPAKATRSQFLPLLHLSIYDTAVQFVDFDNDMVLLHVLMTKLVNALGVNAVRYGLPTIFRLQEDIQDAETPIAKVRLGSLVHGYFWALTDKFGFDTSHVGKVIHNEIVRRRSKHFWVEGVQVPPPTVEVVGIPGIGCSQPRLPPQEVETEALLPFDDREELVEKICSAYLERARLHSTSPAASPGRGLSQHSFVNSTMGSIPPIDAESEFPAHVRDEMLADWSREAVLASAETGSKSASLSGSRNADARNRLAAGLTNGQMNANQNVRSPPSPVGSQSKLRAISQPAPLGTNRPLSHAAQIRKSSVPSNIGSPMIRSSKERVIASVEQLKMVLSGQLEAPTTGLRCFTYDGDSDSSESVLSYDMAPSELSYNPPPVNGVVNKERGAADGESAGTTSRPISRDRKSSLSRGPLTSHPASDDEGENGTIEAVPPVPPLPEGIEGHVPVVSISKPPSHAKDSLRPMTSKRDVRGKIRRLGDPWDGRDRVASGSLGKLDLESMLKGIDSHGGPRSLGPVTKPPY